ncbi:MAG: alpha-L-fucosidase [Lentisphaeria bacterium]|nr:alpha-L-fucosidase [Lentisphaeria bacterium]
MNQPIETQQEGLLKIEKSQPSMQWWRDSMQDVEERMQWWNDARFGCFIHWGVYSELGGLWNDSPVKGYSEHIMRIKQLHKHDYIEQVASKFNPITFDANAWCQRIKEAGMKYVVYTAKHHDGFAMYHSDISSYNVVEQTPFQRDPLMELKEACETHGLKLGIYYSHSQEWGEANGTRNFWEFDHVEHRFWWLEKGQERRNREVSTYYQEKAIPQVLEIVEKYNPAILWFDTPAYASDIDNILLLKALREKAPQLIVNSRIAALDNYGDFLSTCDRPREFPPQKDKYWEGIPTTNESYGYHCMDQSHKPPEHFIKLLIKASEKGGNLLSNIGPKGDGSFDTKDIKILEGIGSWLNKNGEAIYGTEKSPLPAQSWGHMTKKDHLLFLILTNIPENKRILIPEIWGSVAKVYPLSDKDRNVPIQQVAERHCSLKVPHNLQSESYPVICVELEDHQAFDQVRVLQQNQVNNLHGFDAQAIENGLVYGSGHRNDDCIRNFVVGQNQVKWNTFLEVPSKFKVSVRYTANDMDEYGGKFEVQYGPQKLSGTVEPSLNQRHDIGEIELTAGRNEIALKPITQTGRKDVFWFHDIQLEPLN